MPKQPDFIGKVNAVIKYFQNPCDAPWAIYFETALPALGEAIITILSFGFDDVVRGAVRPKGLRSGRHTRGGRKGGRRGGGIPEIGNLLGTMIPGSKAARDRKVSAGVRNLWVLDGIIQRVLWYWLVADVTATFAFNWTSAIQESRFCEKQGVGAALYTMPPGAVVLAVGNFWTTIPTVIKTYQTGTAQAFGAVHSNFGFPFSATSSISGKLIPPFTEGELEMRIVKGGVAGSIIQSTKHADGVESIVGEESSVSPTVQFQVRTNGGGFTVSGESFTMGG